MEIPNLILRQPGKDCYAKLKHKWKNRITRMNIFFIMQKIRVMIFPVYRSLWVSICQ